MVRKIVATLLWLSLLLQNEARNPEVCERSRFKYLLKRLRASFFNESGQGLQCDILK